MAAESWSGSLKPEAKLAEENAVVPTNVITNITKIFFMFYPPNVNKAHIIALSSAIIGTLHKEVKKVLTEGKVRC
jgi:hypothetical protein